LGEGGGIFNQPGGTLVVSGCTFAYNQAIGGSNASAGSGTAKVGEGGGGGLASTFGAIGTVLNSTFDHNLAQGGSGNTGGSGVVLVGAGLGGGIDNLSASFTVGNCTFTANQAVGGVANTGGAFTGSGIGGGFANSAPPPGAGPAPLATVTGSTFTGNQALGCPGVAGGNGGDGLGGALANILGAILTISGCAISGNQATGGAGGNGGNGFGGGLYNDGQSTLTVTGSTITANGATGGAAGSGGSAGQGIGGGAYFASAGTVCLDVLTSIFANTASTSDDDVFGVFTICP
jgi:hypothetical protein